MFSINRKTSAKCKRAEFESRGYFNQEILKPRLV